MTRAIPTATVSFTTSALCARRFRVASRAILVVRRVISIFLVNEELQNHCHADEACRPAIPVMGLDAHEARVNYVSDVLTFVHELGHRRETNHPTADQFGSELPSGQHDG